MNIYRGTIGVGTDIPKNGVYVFSSNKQGLHQLGRALLAYERYGAVTGQSRGFHGHCYAIETKDLGAKEHPSVALISIVLQIWDLYTFAKSRPDLDFYVCFRANATDPSGYRVDEIASCFRIKGIDKIPNNIVFEEGFAKLITSTN